MIEVVFPLRANERPALEAGCPLQLASDALGPPPLTRIVRQHMTLPDEYVRYCAGDGPKETGGRESA